MPTFALPNAPQNLTILLHRIWNVPLPIIPYRYDSLASVSSLVPGIVDAESLD